MRSTLARLGAGGARLRLSWLGLLVVFAAACPASEGDGPRDEDGRAAFEVPDSDAPVSAPDASTFASSSSASGDPASTVLTDAAVPAHMPTDASSPTGQSNSAVAPVLSTGGGCSGYAICGERLGSCGCVEGRFYCFGDTLMQCTGGCLRRLEACGCFASPVDGAAFCAKTLEDCARLKRTYSEVATRWDARPAERATAFGVQVRTCSPERGCFVRRSPAEHCTAGLAPCWYIDSQEAIDPELDRIYQAYVRLGCPRTEHCDCPAPPAELACLERNPYWPPDSIGGGYSTACFTGTPPVAPVKQ